MQILENILQVLITGICIGCLYGLMCMGLSMIFGVMRIVNFAQGEFLMFGMYGALYASVFVIGPQLFGNYTPYLATMLATPLLFLIGVIIYKTMLGASTERRGLSEDTRHSAQLIITLGLSLVFQNGALIVFGTQPQTVRTEFSSTAWIIELFNGDVLWFINQARVIAALLAVAASIAVIILMNRSSLGKSVRAAADDPDAAMYCGISISKVYAITFGLGTAMTAMAGGLMSSFFPFQPYVGSEFVIIMYAGVVLGGMGSMAGAFWGGLVIGLVQQMSVLVLPQQLQNATVFVVFLLVLLLRPNGFFGRNIQRA